MGQIKGDKLADRLAAIAKARQATLDQFRKRAAADDPAVLARQAERQALAEAREVRISEREAARRAADAAREAEALAARERAATDAARQAVEGAEQKAALAAEQQAARDARFAARKAKTRR